MGSRSSPWHRGGIGLLAGAPFEATPLGNVIGNIGRLAHAVVTSDDQALADWGAWFGSNAMFWAAFLLPALVLAAVMNHQRTR